MARTTGWAGIVQMTNPINGTDKPLNAYIEVTAKNRRKAERTLEGVAEAYYPQFREHCALATSPLDSGGTVLEGHIMDHRIDELICDDDIVSMAEEKAVGVSPTTALVVTGKQTVVASPVVTTTVTTYDKPRKLFSEEVLAEIATSRFTYSANFRAKYVAPTTGGTKA